jgi:hypothetical protein
VEKDEEGVQSAQTLGQKIAWSEEALWMKPAAVNSKLSQKKALRFGSAF